MMDWSLPCLEHCSSQSEASKTSGKVIFNMSMLWLSLIGVQIWSAESKFEMLPAEIYNRISTFASNHSIDLLKLAIDKLSTGIQGKIYSM